MYDFKDTAPQSPLDNPLPSEALSINGEYLENIVPGYRTLNAQGRELLGTEIESMQVGGTDGERYKRARKPTREITVEYQLVSSSPAEFRERFNKLAAAINVQQAQLIFADEPDKYFVGSLEEVDDVAPGRLNVTGSFTFFCATPYKYAITKKTAVNDGSNLITLQNDGTATIPIDLLATFAGDNGYIGFTLDDRFYQVGNPGEVDGETYQATEILFDDHLTQDRGWSVNEGITPSVTMVREQIGTWGYKVEVPGEGIAGEGYVYPIDYGAGDSWHGPALTKTVPADENGKYPRDFFSTWRFDFNTAGGSNPGQRAGHQSITFSDTDDNVIVSVVFEDNNYSLERSDMAIYIGNTRAWDSKNTTSFYVTGRGDGAPTCSVEKIGDQITVRFTYGGVQRTLLTTAPDVDLRKVTLYCAQYKSYAPMTNNLLRALQVRKHNVDKWDDIPNFLAAGDTVELDSATNSLYINDLTNWDRVDIGSQPLLLAPGTHTLGFAVSEFSMTVPKVEVSWRERWL